MTEEKFSDYRLFGRRQSSPLSPRQQVFVDELLPRVRVPLPADTEIELQLRGAFAKEYEQYHLEIGFGGAEHLVWQAQRAPDIGFIGCEPFLNGVVKLLTSIDELELSNVRVHDHDARDFLDRLPQSCFDKVYILFPDPWPKKRHRKRRFINQKTLNQIARVLKPGAPLCFASDIPDYVEWVQEHIAENVNFEFQETDTAERPVTRYEQKAIREGRTPVYKTIACIK